MATVVRGVILVGHGGIPKGCPQEWITKLKRLEGQRRTAGTPRSTEELELDTKIRRWPRTPETDPYQSGLEAVAAQLRANIGDVLFAVAYNEFCAPTLEESVEELIKKGATHITVTTTMFTPGVLIQKLRFLKSSIICGHSIQGSNSATPGRSI
jgi:sirohydrochlorin cobaltochelatase